MAAKPLTLNLLKDKRIFDFVITVPDVLDSQGEQFVDAELPEALDLWLMNDAPINMEHTNKKIGKGVRWWTEMIKADDDKFHKAYIGRGLVEENPVGDVAWNNILSGKFADVSIGGVSLAPTDKADGTTQLKDSYVIEVSVCEDGMHPNADIIGYNEFAKSRNVKYFAKAKIRIPNSEKANHDSETYELLKSTQGGFFMAEAKNAMQNGQMQDETQGSNYVTREELGQALSSLKEQIVAELKAPAKEPAAAQDAGKATNKGEGKPSPDNIEEELDDNTARTQDENSQQDDSKKDLSTLSNAAKAEMAKAVKEEVLAEVKKSFNMTSTPRPGMEVNKSTKDEEEDFDAYRDVVKSNKPLDFAALRSAERARREKSIAAALG